MLRLLITKSYLEPHNYLTCVIRIRSARVIFFSAKTSSHGFWNVGIINVPCT